MENQAEKRISRNGLSFVMLSIALGWALDLMSSLIGIQIGLQEASPYFFVFPAVWLIWAECLIVFVYWMPRAPFWVKGSIMLWMIAFSFIPSVRNTALILGVVF